VTVGSAYHWFRHDEALPELHRVLRPGGAVALIWNAREGERPLQQEISELIKPLAPPDRPTAGRSATELAKSGLFGPVEQRGFPFVQRLDADGVADRIASVSYVAAAPAEQRAELDRKLREVVAAQGGVVDFPYVAEVYLSRRAA
jgi:SAM-dependent methyltransferase